MNLRQFLLILRARWKTALLTFLALIAGALAVSLLLPNQYSASTSVVVDVKSPDPIAGILLPAIAVPGYMATQVDIISSDRVARKVVAMLRLTESPAARQQWLSDTGGKGNIGVWLAELLQDKLEIKPSRESNVINIGYKAADPAFAAAVANAFANAYIATTVELRVEPARQYAEWFGDQSRALRESLERAQAKLSAYQQEHGIVASDERLDNENIKLNEISTQLTIARAQTMEARSKQAAPQTLQDYLQSPMIQRLKDRIAEQEAKLQAVGRNAGTNHPDYQRIQSEIASLNKALESEKQQIDKSFAAATGVGTDKEAALRAAYDAQKERLLRIRRERDELAVLLRDVDAAQKAYETVSQRFSSTRLESQSTQTNVAVLTPASEPLEPSSPKILLNMLIAVFMGTIFGIAAALLREMLDRRIRSTDDLVDIGPLPVLAVLSNVQGRRARGFRLLGSSALRAASAR